MRSIPVPVSCPDFKSHFAVYPWLHSVKPFHMIGNIYYIGDDFAASLLISTSKGLLIIDTGMPQCAAFLVQNIWELGFKPSDVKKILHTHAHFDHTGASMCLKQLSNAQLYMSETDVNMYFEHPELTTLGHTEMGWPLTQIDTELHDGETVTLGETVVRCVSTPGHTDGTLSFLLNVPVNGKDYQAALFGGAGLNTLTTEYLMTNFGNLRNRDKYLHSLDILDSFKNIDITLSNHPAMNHTFEKQKLNESDHSVNHFLDPSEWKSYVKNLYTDYQKFLKDQCD